MSWVQEFMNQMLPAVICRYNAIAYVPYQLERLLWYGLLLCCNSFLVGLKPTLQRQQHLVQIEVLTAQHAFAQFTIAAIITQPRHIWLAQILAFQLDT